ncbi:hypothetical protein ZIOFF_043673 [Zingiber officinale]|uniref:Uncharacterized protein n=1 Tax=Zingiber officinale TaxID=94328 RepID=A0A8J5G4M1_ZINOF|nr:hypothetical protein ZIOFF_043673 [Zingiber officinale]
MKRQLYFSLFCKTVPSTSSPRPHDAALVFAVLPYSASATATAAGAASISGKHMFMAQYLVDSCGFDQEKTTEASKLLKGIQSRQQPDSVLAFLKSYGFDDASGLLGSKDALVRLFKRKQGILVYNIEKKIQPNLELLRECGLDGQKLAFILRNRPLIVAQNADFLKFLISCVEDLGVPQTSGMFHCTLCALFVVNPNKFKMQMELFWSFGWSEDDVVAAFQKYPAMPGRSLKTLQRNIEFLINEAGYASSYIATHPILLIFSLERRMIPRHGILAALKSRGHCASDYKVATYMQVSEIKFVEKYIVGYEDRYPDLSELYASLNTHKCF